MKTASILSGPPELAEPEETQDTARPALAPEKLLQNWRGAFERARAYLRELGVPAAASEKLARKAVERAAYDVDWPADGRSNACAETLRAARELVQEEFPRSRREPLTNIDRFVDWCLEQAAGNVWPGAARFSSTPPLTRRSMRPNRFTSGGLRRPSILPKRRSIGADGLPPDEAGEPDYRPLRKRRRALPWPRVAYRRRLLLTVLVLIPSVVATEFMIEVLPHQGRNWLEVAISLFFGALFGWISIGFWTALLGFFILAGRRDRFSITASLEGKDVPIPPEVRTAIVMPIYEEPVDRVFAGLKAIYKSVERAGVLEHFDFFILSDTVDAAHWVREEEAWFDLCRSTGGFGRIFYRHRRVRVALKSGNIADFCRRWGAQYRYMVMLDADSVMSGETLKRLVQLMEAHPDVGMIQTAPNAVNRRSLFARIQQFAGQVYGPMFAAGLHYWQLGDGQYWGHNAIIRVTPFMENCALPRLPGKPPLGGEILSHDFVEAALMGRAGWTLWLAFDLDGSWEETPSTLLEEMNRDRRWCQGNLQHLQLFFARGFFGAHRALFLNGVLAYVSALLWLCFLTLSTAQAIVEAIRPPDYFPEGPSLFPEWPVWRPDWQLALLAVIAAILFLPKLLGIALITIKWRKAREFGGFLRLCLSVFFEILVSSLLAPIRMAFHTRFVIANLFGRTVVWKTQTREDQETTWGQALRHHGLDTVIGTVWGIAVFWLNPGYFWWLTPIVAALILSIPISVYASRVSWGDRARRAGIFQIPEETNPPQELRDMEAELRLSTQRRDGFRRAVASPVVNALHLALLRRQRQVKPSIAEHREAVFAKARKAGPDALTPFERRMLLYDPEFVARLHAAAWESEAVGRLFDVPAS